VGSGQHLSRLVFVLVAFGIFVGVLLLLVV